MVQSFVKAQPSEHQEIASSDYHKTTTTEEGEGKADNHSSIDYSAVLRGQGKDGAYIYIPDEASPFCVQCSQTYFNFFHRRHHVRMLLTSFPLLSILLLTYVHVSSLTHHLLLYIHQCRACGSLVCSTCLIHHQDLYSVILGSHPSKVVGKDRVKKKKI